MSELNELNELDELRKGDFFKSGKYLLYVVRILKKEEVVEVRVFNGTLNLGISRFSLPRPATWKKVAQ